MAYVNRIADTELDELLPSLPAIALEGARGVGKTQTAMQRAATVHQLDDEAQRTIASAEPERLLEGPAPILLDEWQRLPSLWDRVRRAVDAGAPAGSFLLAGSATPNRAPTHSGAGRIVTVRMRPLTLAERGRDVPTVSLGALLSGTRGGIEGSTEVTLTAYTEEIIRSGFPGLRHLSGRALRAQLDGYLERIVDTDFEELGHSVRRPGTLRRWMAAYGAATSTSTTFEKLRDAATPGEADKPARTTTGPYRETLERLFVLDPVPAWVPTRNTLNRLTQLPKHHLVDPALAARLLGVDEGALLDGRSPGPTVPRDGTLLGHLFESLVTQSVRVYAQANEARIGHMRTYGGKREVDLIVERDDSRVVAIEVKLKRVVEDADVRQLHWLAGKLGKDLLDMVIITTGPYAYRREDGIAVVPAALLGP